MLTEKINTDFAFNHLYNTVYTSDKSIIDLHDEFSQLTDVRCSSGKRHELGLVVTIATLGMMNGYDGFNAISDFITRYNYELISIFRPKKDRLPSLSTIRRVMNNVDFDELCMIFARWANTNVEIQVGDWISFDGKAIKGTIPDQKYKFTNLISMFSVKLKQVISMEKVDEKSNEIPKAQKLIENNSLSNVTYIADAMHCQKKTISTIILNNSNYVLQVKANQQKLLRKVKFIARVLPALSEHVTKEKNRGRLEIRKVSVHRECLDLEYHGWDDIKSIIKVERTVKHKSGKISNETAYFITNMQDDASIFNKGIRDHWKIENSLHYVKDVTFNEDRLKIRTGNGPQNMSLLRTLVINILRKKGFSSIKQAIRLLAGNIVQMVNMLR
jgi:predicted transposase YbfD/YdcC